MQNNGTTLSYTIGKNSKWIANLNIRTKTIKSLIENIGVKLLNIHLGNNIFNLTQKQRQQNVHEIVKEVGMLNHHFYEVLC